MAKLSFRAGTTSKIVRVFIQDSSQTDGRGLTGLVFNSGSLTAYYIKEGDASPTVITLVTATVGTWTSSGFVQIDATNMPGWYELHLPNAAIASGKSTGVMLKGAANMVQTVLEIELEAVDNQDTVRLGLTALPNAAAGANGGLPTGNASGQVAVATIASGAITATAIAADAITAAKVADGTIDAATFAAGAITAAAIAADAITAAKVADGTIDAATFAAGAINAAAIATDAITAAKIAADAIGASELAADAVTEIQSGLATASALATVQADTDDIQTRIPAALVGGRMDSSVGAMAAAVLTATAIAADAITAAKIAADAIGASELAADAVTEIQNGLALATALATAQTAITDIQSRIPTALVSGRIDSSVGAMATSVITATAIAADAIGASEIASDAIAEIQSGLATASALATVQSDTDDIQSRLPAALVGGKIDANVGALGSGSITSATFAAGAIDAAAIATDAIGSAELAASAVTEIQTGLATSAALATVQADTDDIQTRLPSALVGGKIDANVGALGAGSITSATFAAGAIDASAIATDAIGSNEVAASAVTKIQSGLATSAALAIVAGFIDTEIADIQARLPAALVGGRIDSSIGAMAANTLTASALASDAVDEILDDTIGDGSITVRQALRVLIAGMAGKLSGAATTTVTIRNLADSANVVQATVDASGNRSAVTVTP